MCEPIASVQIHDPQTNNDKYLPICFGFDAKNLEKRCNLVVQEQLKKRVFYFSKKNRDLIEGSTKMLFSSLTIIVSLYVMPPPPPQKIKQMHLGHVHYTNKVVYIYSHFLFNL